MGRTLSVIVATWNGEETIGEQLEALAGQTYDGSWELIVADNGSSDRTLEIARAFKDKMPHLRVIDASARRGPGAAYNIAATVAAGDAFLFCDQDDVVQPGWLGAMAAALERHHLVAGEIQFLGVMHPEKASPSTKGHVTGSGGREKSGHDFFAFLPYGLTANLSVSRTALERVAGFDEKLPTEDVDFCWRVQLAGFDLHVEPAAIVLKRRRERLEEVWRQHFRYGIVHPILFKKFRRYGMPRNLGRAARQYAWLLLHVGDFFIGERQGVWLRVAAGQMGRLVGSVRVGTLYL
ncbi:MAG: glycosyltransferase [bacterium]